MWFIDENTLHLLDINEYIGWVATRISWLMSYFVVVVWFAEIKKRCRMLNGQNRRQCVECSSSSSLTLHVVHIAKCYRVLFILSIRIIGQYEAIYCTWQWKMCQKNIDFYSSVSISLVSTSKRNSYTINQCLCLHAMFTLKNPTEKKYYENNVKNMVMMGTFKCSELS